MKNMEISSQILSIFHIHEGLCDGLSHFSGQSRAALIYAEKQGDPPRVYDPQNLLEGWEAILEKIYLRSEAWRRYDSHVTQMRLFGQVFPEKGLDLAGLVSWGGRAKSVSTRCGLPKSTRPCARPAPQRGGWSTLPASWPMTGPMRNGSIRETRPMLSGNMRPTRSGITSGIGLDLKFGLDSRIEVYPILDAVLGISKTREEGAWPRGTLVFIDPAMIAAVPFLVRFPHPERLRLTNYKHVRKLILAVENSERMLVSDGRNIIGVAQGSLPDCRITADFRGGHGFLRFSGNLVCSFSDGSYHSSNRRPNLVHLEELLLESSLEGDKK